MTDLVDVANGQVGYVEQGGSDGHSGNITRYGKAYGLDGYAWCSVFVWWCFAQLGVDVRHDVSKNYAGAENAMEGFKSHGWEIVSHPQRNDVVFFHFSGEHAGANHTGIVVSADANGVHTIEGNTSAGNSGSQANGGGVYRRYRPYSVIIGYGREPRANGSGHASAPAPAPAHVAPTKSYPTLKEGMGTSAHPDANVKRMQTLLHVSADGIFGSGTLAAVKHFQSIHHLQVDGTAGPATLKAMGW